MTERLDDTRVRLIAAAIVAIGIYNIPTFARITRASANAIWSREFVLASRACGHSPIRPRVQRDPTYGYASP